MAGEVRDTAGRQVTFFAVAFPSARVLWKDVRVEEQWWTGLDRVDDDLVFIHGFTAPDFPVRRGITVLDAGSGALLWTNATWTLEAVADGTARVLTDVRDADPVLAVDARTGTITGRGAAVPPPAVRAAWWDTVSYPEAWPADRCADTPAGAAVRAWGAGAIVGEVEVLALPDVTVVAAAVQKKWFSAVMLTHMLAVVENGSGRIVHEATLRREAKGAVIEAFFVQERTLVYIQHGGALCLYPL